MQSRLEASPPLLSAAEHFILVNMDAVRELPVRHTCTLRQMVTQLKPHEQRNVTAQAAEKSEQRGIQPEDPTGSYVWWIPW